MSKSFHSVYIKNIVKSSEQISFIAYILSLRVNIYINKNDGQLELWAWVKWKKKENDLSIYRV